MASQQISVTDLDQIATLAEAGGELVCKFVLLSHKKGLALVFGSLEKFPYHAHLASKFCDMKSIPSGWVKKPDLVEIYDPDVRILGGGYFRFGPIPMELTIFGASTAYGKCRKSDLEHVVTSSDFFSIYNIQIKS